MTNINIQLPQPNVQEIEVPDDRTVQAKGVQETGRSGEQLVLPEQAASIEHVQSEQPKPRITGKLVDGGNPTFVRVKDFLVDHPTAKVREVSEALKIAPSTAHAYMKKVRNM